MFNKCNVGLRLGTECKVNDNMFIDCIENAVEIYDNIDVELYRNIFINNTVLDRGTRTIWNSSDGIGNYWYDWLGPDSDEDGIVDVPRPINVGNGIYDNGPISRINSTLLPPPKEFKGIVNEDHILLTWKRPDRNPFMDPFTYTLYRSEDGRDLKMIGVFEEDQTSYEDRSLEDLVEYSYYMLSENSFGTGKRSSVIMLELDRTGPVLNISNPKEGELINVSNVTVEWEIFDPSGIGSFEVRMDNGSWISMVSEKNHTFTDLSDGVHTVFFRASDVFGNEVERSIHFTVDTTPPMVSISIPVEGRYTNISTMDVSWDCYDAVSGIDEVHLLIDGISGIVPVNGTRSISFYEGEHTIMIRAMDLAGFETVMTQHFEVDVRSPFLEILEPINGTLTNSKKVMLIWNCSDLGSGIILISGIVDSKEEFHPLWVDEEFELNLEDGEHSISLTVHDRAGNHRTETVWITVDTVPPEIVSYGPVGSGANVSESAFVRFSEDVREGSIEFIIIGISGQLRWENDTLFFDPASDFFHNRTYDVMVRAEDLAGNPGYFEWSFRTEEEVETNGNGIDHPKDDYLFLVVMGFAIIIMVLIVAFLLYMRSSKRMKGSKEE